jgi:type VI secretion system secreted protein VgrG
VPDAKYSQLDRLLRIKSSSVEEGQLLLERFSGTEAVSTPFEFKLRLLSPNAELDLQKLLRTPATVFLVLADGTDRTINGRFRSLKQSQEGEGLIPDRPMAVYAPGRELTVYEGVLVPQVWFLSLTSDCRIFQNLSVPDIVEKVLKDGGVTDLRFALQDKSKYKKRDYCVQYRESHLNFISRLLDEEGICYYFEHTDKKHTIVFSDNSTIAPKCPKQEKATYAYSQSGWVSGKEDGVINLERVEQAHTGKVGLTDYNFETPSTNLKATLGSKDEEVYDYPGKYADVEEGNRYARIRLEEREAEQFLLNGISRCRSFLPGYLFKLNEHYRKDTNGDYFLVSVTHEALDTTYRHGDDDAASYQNTFTAIPKAVPYRPPQRAIKPVVQGPQPGLVVGKAGEEIWVDKYGRVKVQFYWDRLGKKNEESSCWIRVSQIWAGKNWGWMTIPRIGQEVIVDFVEGDPDRPIITGRVYNAEQMPPYTLNANQTQSGIKSRSSKAGAAANFNEIRFEDLKGSEMFTMHAEKDMESFVEHDDSQTVQNNRTIKVDGTHTETIKKDTTITITEGNHSLTLNKGNQSITLDMGNQGTKLSKGNQSITLNMGNQSTKLDLGKSTTEAMQSIELTVGQSSIKISQTGITIKAMMITIEGSTITTVKGGLFLTLKGGLTLIN